MREMMIGRAVPPEPAIAPSTHVLPVAVHASANLETAAASPPDVSSLVLNRCRNFYIDLDIAGKT